MHSIVPKQKFGQNFLHNEETAARFASYLTKSEKVLEIGPGLGAITKLLAKRCHKLTCIEIDPELEKRLEKTLKNFNVKNTKIIIGDALFENFSQFDVIAGALPYNLASKIIEKFMQSNCPNALFIVQKEVGERLIAKPGYSGYSRLSILAQNGAEVEILEIIPEDDFWPKPEVKGAVVRIKKTGKKFNINPELVKALFQHKNQNVRKALRHSGKKWKKTMEKLTYEIAIKRARELTLQELEQIGKLT